VVRAGHTPRVTIAAASCFTIALLAELAGIALIVRNGRAARRVLTDWSRPAGTAAAEGPRTVFRQRSAQLAHSQLEVDERVLEHVLDSQARWGMAAGLLVTGVVVGSLGNFLSLSW
jgi:hypothetical protein